MQKIDLDKMSLLELKALAYDTVCSLENIKNNLSKLDQEIIKRLKQEELKKQEKKEIDYEEVK